MNYNLNVERLTVRDAQDVLIAAQKAANWASHGGTCRGWQPFSINQRTRERKATRDVDPNDRELWWQEFDESKCTCGLLELKKLTVNHRLTDAMSKSLRKGGFNVGADTNEKRLGLEIDELRLKLTETLAELDEAHDANAKLQRKLQQIKDAAKQES